MEEIEINIYPLLEWVVILFAVVGAFWTVNSLTQVIVNSKKDLSITKSFLEKYPLVNSEYIQKDVKAQNIENNQEIHEINKKLENLEDKINKILGL